jgi:hypothetical protein
MANTSYADQTPKKLKLKALHLAMTLCNTLMNYRKNKGDGLSRKGKHIVHEDLEIAFDKFDVFLAHLDDAYTGNDNSTELSVLEAEPETESHVNSFSISGVEENKSLIIRVQRVTNGVIKFSSPR